MARKAGVPPPHDDLGAGNTATPHATGHDITGPATLLYTVGRFLQLVGLGILPLAILLELQSAVTLWKSLAVSGFGVLLFSVGYVLQSIGGKVS